MEWSSYHATFCYERFWAMPLFILELVVAMKTAVTNTQVYIVEDYWHELWGADFKV